MKQELWEGLSLQMWKLRAKEPWQGLCQTSFP